MCEKSVHFLFYLIQTYDFNANGFKSIAVSYLCFLFEPVMNSLDLLRISFALRTDLASYVCTLQFSVAKHWRKKLFQIPKSIKQFYGDRACECVIWIYHSIQCYDHPGFLKSSFFLWKKTHFLPRRTATKRF